MIDNISIWGGWCLPHHYTGTEVPNLMKLVDGDIYMGT